MTNGRLRNLVKRKSELINERRKAKQELRKAERNFARLDEEFDEVCRTKEVFRGICLTGDGLRSSRTRGSIYTAAPDDKNDRWADYWQNVNDHKDWRVTLRDRGSSGFYSDVMSKYFMTRDQALLVCKEWVARGIKPPKET